MNIVVIDGQGGKLGKQIVENIADKYPDVRITAIGTNSVATVTMQKGGATEFATGENSVICCAENADVIIGPIGIAIANSLLGEITPKMAEAVGKSKAVKILIPLNKCNNMIAGVSKMAVSEMLKDADRILDEIILNK